jgi:hypothetical protein
LKEHQDEWSKKLFSFPAMVEDLIRGFVREQWVDDLDFSTLERKNAGSSTSLGDISTRWPNDLIR